MWLRDLLSFGWDFLVCLNYQTKRYTDLGTSSNSSQQNNLIIQSIHGLFCCWMSKMHLNPELLNGKPYFLTLLFWLEFSALAWFLVDFFHDIKLFQECLCWHSLLFHCYCSSVEFSFRKIRIPTKCYDEIYFLRC